MTFQTQIVWVISSKKMKAKFRKLKKKKKHEEEIEEHLKKKQSEWLKVEVI